MSPQARLPREEIFLDTSWLLMSWDPYHQCVLAEWRGFATHAEWQGAFMAAIEALIAKRSERFINDIRKLESVNDEDRRWLRQTWAPLALAAGLKRVAVVAAPSGLARFAVDEMREQSRDPILDWRILTTMSDALRWVTEDRPEGSS